MTFRVVAITLKKLRRLNILTLIVLQHSKALGVVDGFEQSLFELLAR